MKRPKVLGLIPARGGSKGIPRKNLRLLAGKPLIYWSINAAMKSKSIDSVVVSTEDQEIADVSKKYGADVPFIRPKELAQDNSLRNEVVQHALGELCEFDYLVLLQPTSPLRKSTHIDEAFTRLLESDAKSLVSVTEQHPSPEWIFQLSKSGRFICKSNLLKSTNRQSFPNYYKLNGAIYIIGAEQFLTSSLPDPFISNDTLGFIMPKEQSVDIDDKQDFLYCENQLKRMSPRIIL